MARGVVRSIAAMGGVMGDLFPRSLEPDAVGFDAVRFIAPVFFAIYPSAEDLPRVVAWQRHVCESLAPARVSPRPPELLHVSVAACGVPTRQRQPLDESLQLAAERFVFPSFELVLDAVARFGRDDDALVGTADQAGTRAVHGLRVALAGAQKPFGLQGSRARAEAHLTLGYGDGLSADRLPFEPLRFRVGAVDLVASDVGHSRHIHLDRWHLR